MEVQKMITFYWLNRMLIIASSHENNNSMQLSNLLQEWFLVLVGLENHNIKSKENQL